jgi:hypothetical protein
MTPLEYFEDKLRGLLNAPLDFVDDLDHYEELLLIAFTTAMQCTMEDTPPEYRYGLDVGFLEQWDEFCAANPINTAEEVSERLFQLVTSIAPDMAQVLRPINPEAN